MLELPDEPRWVEAHGIAADPTSWHRRVGAGGAVGNAGAQLAVVFGAADAAATAALARELAGYTLLVGSESLAHALRDTGRGVDRALIHTLEDASALPDLDGAVRLPDDASLDHVPAPLARELAEARTRSTIWTVYVDGLPVSFASAPWRSPRWFDISVDTLPSARQLGLATIVASAMIQAERAAGREPVWGADEDNHASLRLARRLGFVAVDELWVAAR